MTKANLPAGIKDYVMKLYEKLNSKFKRLKYSILLLFVVVLFFACKSFVTTKGTASASVVTGELSLIAGKIDGAGHNDGVGSVARFSHGRVPYIHLIGMVTDAEGNMYVTDTGNHTIRKITPQGVVTTLAGLAGKPGSSDGNGAVAQFNSPSGIAMDKSGNLFVADTLNQTIRKITTTGVVTTIAGSPLRSGSSDGDGTSARFNRPSGIVADKDGNLFIADCFNKTIRKLSPEGAVITYAGAPGSKSIAEGYRTSARFIYPEGLAIDSVGNLYVSEAPGYGIRKITTTGWVTTLAGTVSVKAKENEKSEKIRPMYFKGMTFDPNDNLFVCDPTSSIIYKVSSEGVTTFAGTIGKAGSSDGVGLGSRFRTPCGITTDSAGNLYVADIGDATVRKVSPLGIVTTLAGSARVGEWADGIGGAARFNEPRGITADLAGNMYVADCGNHVIRKITPSGVVTTLAGTPGKRGSSEGRGNAALFCDPTDIAIDKVGNLYVVDNGDSTIRKVTPDGVVTFFAGRAGKVGDDDGPVEIARFRFPNGITIDSNGNIFVADGANNAIRKIAGNGMVTTVAGHRFGGSGNGDGPGWNASFSHPSRITSDRAGNLFVSNGNAIRKITPEGEVSTLAGLGGEIGSTDYSGGLARFFAPIGLSTNGPGTSLYVADSGNHTIRRVTSIGDVTTVAGIAGRQGIITSALPGGLDTPAGLTRIGPNMFAVTTGNAILKLVIHQ